MMIEAVPPRVRVLDVGCAGGYLARPLTEAGCTVVGVEPDPRGGRERPRVLRERDPGRLRGPAVRAGLPGPFDAVIFGDVLEHLRDPGPRSRGAHPSAAPDARVIVSIPNIAHWSARLTLLRGRFPHADSGLFDKTHLRFFTRRSARRAGRAHRLRHRARAVHALGAAVRAVRALRARPHRGGRRAAQAGAVCASVRSDSAACASCPGVKAPVPSHHGQGTVLGEPPRLDTI